MALYIRDNRAALLARRLAARKGTTLTQAVMTALENALALETRPLPDRIADIARDASHLGRGGRTAKKREMDNWLSWADQTYPSEESKDGTTLKIDQLLARTVFYKVGHHASHNATLRDRGLELMNHPDLCAMIPVVEKTAREQKTKKTPGGWAMPYADLYKCLAERTEDRIIRGDGDVGMESKYFGKSIFTLSYGSTFKSGDPLWAELSLDL